MTACVVHTRADLRALSMANYTARIVQRYQRGVAKSLGM